MPEKSVCPKIAVTMGWSAGILFKIKQWNTKQILSYYVKHLNVKGTKAKVVVVVVAVNENLE